jgi:hypothetical protein
LAASGLDVILFLEFVFLFFFVPLNYFRFAGSRPTPPSCASCSLPGCHQEKGWRQQSIIPLALFSVLASTSLSLSLSLAFLVKCPPIDRPLRRKRLISSQLPGHKRGVAELCVAHSKFVNFLGLKVLIYVSCREPVQLDTKPKLQCQNLYFVLPGEMSFCATPPLPWFAGQISRTEGCLPFNVLLLRPPPSL